MGHTRIGRIPKSRTWESILQLLNDDSRVQPLSAEEITKIANESIFATEKGLSEASNDIGVYNAIFIFTKILESIALKSTDSNYYIDINKISDIREFAFEINSRIRSYFIDNCISTDKSELALKAISKSILETKYQAQYSLIDNAEADNGVKKLATKNGFADFGQNFIANYVYFYTNFFLSRLTNFSVGSDQIKNISQLTQFNNETQKHWKESANIVKELSGDWFAKKVFHERDITRQTVKEYLSFAFKKMRLEAETQRGAK
jgi:hypothetical protein